MKLYMVWLITLLRLRHLWGSWTSLNILFSYLFDIFFSHLKMLIPKCYLNYYRYLAQTQQQ